MFNAMLWPDDTARNSNLLPWANVVCIAVAGVARQFLQHDTPGPECRPTSSVAPPFDVKMSVS